MAGSDNPEEVWRAFAGLPGVEQVEPIAKQEDGMFRARLYVTGEAAAMVLPVSEAVRTGGARLAEIALTEPSLEDVFIGLTGRRLR